MCTNFHAQSVNAANNEEWNILSKLGSKHSTKRTLMTNDHASKEKEIAITFRWKSKIMKRNQRVETIIDDAHIFSNSPNTFIYTGREWTVEFETLQTNGKVKHECKRRENGDKSFEASSQWTSRNIPWLVMKKRVNPHQTIVFRW